MFYNMTNIPQHAEWMGFMAIAITPKNPPAISADQHAALARVLVFLAVVSTAVASLGAPLLPTIVAVDRVSLAASQWALTISLLVGAMATPLLGRMGDGRRPLWRRQARWLPAAPSRPCPSALA